MTFISIAYIFEEIASQMASDQSTFFSQHRYVKELNGLNDMHADRRQFHNAVQPLLVRMASDKEFMHQVIKRNFTDKGWLQHDWSDYNIPFFYVHETDDYVIKVHLFPAGPQDKLDHAAHAIHHHNNYLLTTHAFFGSGYESLLFEKEVEVNDDTMEVNLKIRKHFHQRDWNPSMVDSWEPHLVFLPESLSATFLMWTPDAQRKTDRFRNSKLLKPFKRELRHLIYKLGAGDKLGIAREKTYQYYVQDGKRIAITEEEYFAPSKAANGPAEKEYAMQMIFSFLQQADLIDETMLGTVLKDEEAPAYYKTFIERVLSGEQIPEVLHRHEINIPKKSYTRDEVLSACS